MKKFALIFSLLIFLFFLNKISVAQTDPCSNPSSLNLNGIQTCLQNIQSAYDQSVKATQPLQSELNALKTQVDGIKERITEIGNDLAIKEQKLDEGYKELTKQKESLNEIIADYYIRSSQDNLLYDLLSNPSLASWAQIAGQKKFLIQQDKEKMINFALLLTDLENQKKDLENEQTQLTAVKASLDDQSAKLNKVVSGALAYQATLSSQIAALSSAQRNLLGVRLSALGIPLYATTSSGCSPDFGKDPGFSPRFAFYTYGVPNRVGLSQYGAMGRAAAGQSYDQILHAYYNFDNYNVISPSSITINVNDSNGYGSGNIIWSGTLDQYIRRIFEVPDNWPAESLKAQIIAATSYVLSETNNGSMSICANTHCQVFQTNEKGGGWGDAVSALENDKGGLPTMTNGGQVITAWFSSTHGGFVHASGGDIGGASWTKNAVDTQSGSVSGWDDLKNNAFDKSSPWFYCDWGNRGQNNTAFLSSSDLADIANVILLVQATNGDQSITQHLYQTDKSGTNPSGTDTWSADRVKQELQNRGVTPINSVSNASISGVDWGSGTTTSVTIEGRSFPGDLFKTYFNLRAPANIQIVGPLYNIETN